MEWVETTGTTLEAAKEAALDELGVDEQDAEFEILQEPKIGLFGRVRAEARIRARVRPTAPRAKEDRRDRRRSRNRDAQAGGGGGAPAAASAAGEEDEAPAAAGAGGGGGTRSRRRRGSGGGGALGTVEREDSATSGGSGEANGPNGSGEARPRRSRSRAAEGDGAAGAARGGRTSRAGQSKSNDRAGEGPTVEVPLEEQGRVAEEFLQGLVAQFGLRATTSVKQPDEDNVEVAVSGDDLGLLIGPKGATLLAIQDLTRTVVQRKTSASNGRIHVDVGAYREKRAAALANFARQVAAQVQSTGSRRALEPMSAADRKVVHDALNDVEGVQTISEGEDPQRRVVILPEADGNES